MDWTEKIVTSLPIEQLWVDEGPVNASRTRAVGTTALTDLLRAGPVRFVVINLGERPRWIPEEACFTFWKSEVKGRVIEPDGDEIYLDQFPGGYCYWASEWVSDSGSPIVVLEMSH